MTGIKWQKPYTPRTELAKRPLGKTGGAPIPLMTIPLYLDEIDARDRRIAELEAALRQIAEEVATATDGGHIHSVREICKKALEK